MRHILTFFSCQTRFRIAVIIVVQRMLSSAALVAAQTILFEQLCPHQTYFLISFNNSSHGQTTLMGSADICPGDQVEHSQIEKSNPVIGVNDVKTALPGQFVALIRHSMPIWL